MTPLQKNIKDFLDINNLSITAFERKAGLKPHSIYNILKGSAKKPRQEKLNAIASFMDCDIQELLENNSSKTVGHDSFKIEEEKKTPWNASLYFSIIKKLDAALEQKHLTLSAEKITTMAWEAYKYSLINNLTAIDDKFINWLVNKDL